MGKKSHAPKVVLDRNVLAVAEKQRSLKRAKRTHKSLRATATVAVTTAIVAEHALPQTLVEVQIEALRQYADGLRRQQEESNRGRHQREKELATLEETEQVADALVLQMAGELEKKRKELATMRCSITKLRKTLESMPRAEVLQGVVDMADSIVSQALEPERPPLAPVVAQVSNSSSDEEEDDDDEDDSSVEEEEQMQWQGSPLFGVGEPPVLAATQSYEPLPAEHQSSPAHSLFLS